MSRTQTVRLEIIQTPGTALTNPLVAAGAVPTKEVPPASRSFLSAINPLTPVGPIIYSAFNRGFFLEKAHEYAGQVSDR